MHAYIHAYIRKYIYVKKKYLSVKGSKWLTASLYFSLSKDKHIFKNAATVLCITDTCLTEASMDSTLGAVSDTEAGWQFLPSDPTSSVPGGCSAPRTAAIPSEQSPTIPYSGKPGSEWCAALTHPNLYKWTHVFLVLGYLTFYFRQVERLQMSKNMPGYFSILAKEMHLLYLQAKCNTNKLLFSN